MAIWNERIRNKRLEKGYTLAQIADALGVTEATAQRYESGSIKSVPYDHMCAYGKLFNCSPAYLMGWENEPKQNCDWIIETESNNKILIEVKTNSKNDLNHANKVKSLLDTYYMLSPEFQNQLIEYARRLKALQDLEFEIAKPSSVKLNSDDLNSLANGSLASINEISKDA